MCDFDEGNRLREFEAGKEGGCELASLDEEILIEKFRSGYASVGRFRLLGPTPKKKTEFHFRADSKW